MLSIRKITDMKCWISSCNYHVIIFYLNKERPLSAAFLYFKMAVFFHILVKINKFPEYGTNYELRAEAWNKNLREEEEELCERYEDLGFHYSEKEGKWMEGFYEEREEQGMTEEEYYQKLGMEQDGMEQEIYSDYNALTEYYREIDEKTNQTVETHVMEDGAMDKEMAREALKDQQELTGFGKGEIDIPVYDEEMAQAAIEKSLSDLQKKAGSYLSDGMKNTGAEDFLKKMQEAVMNPENAPEKIDSLVRTQMSRNELETANAVREFKNSLLEAKDKGLTDDVLRGLSESLEDIKCFAKEENENILKISEKMKRDVLTAKGTADKYANALAGLSQAELKKAASGFEEYKNCLTAQGIKIKDTSSKIGTYTRAQSLKLYNAVRSMEIRSLSRTYARESRSLEQIEKKLEKSIEKINKRQNRLHIFRKNRTGMKPKEQKMFDVLQSQRAAILGRMMKLEKTITEQKMDIVTKAYNLRGLMKELGMSGKEQENMNKMINSHSRSIKLKSAEERIRDAKNVLESSKKNTGRTDKSSVEER